MIIRKSGFIILLLLCWGCSTKKNTWLSRNYHNLTAYYNVYYNGREALENGVRSIRKNYRNDYTKILPMFESSDPDATGVATGDMDRAIEKGTKLIKKHSITKRPKRKKGSKGRSDEFYSRNEYNNWVDNAYLLIGQAQYYKHDYLQAIRTFQYVSREFKDTPARYEALIWIARSYTEYNDFIGALSALESYDLGTEAPEELYADYMSAYANFLLTQEKYTEAIPFLKNSIASSKDKHQKIRFSYILGQLYTQNNQREEAIEAFTYAAKASKDYEMTFNAKVNKASMIYADANIEEVKKQLNKLRRDRKNRDYLDRIYWAFGQVAEQEGDFEEALRYYKKSLASSVDNNHQKGVSYISAATIYYDQFEYPDAYFYYDSALTVIEQDFEDYDKLLERHDGLSGLVESILTVQREDSLQRLADMNESDRLAYLDGIIAQKEEEKRIAERKAEEDAFEDPFFFNNMNNSATSNQQSDGKWYFYNPNSRGLGEMEFEQRWGKRRLEDNWRRSDKGKNFDDSEVDPMGLPDDPFALQGDSLINTTEGVNAEERQPVVPAGEVPTREQLLADIPLSPADRLASDKMIETSLMEMGLAFMDRLQNYPKAIDALEDLLSRYPYAENRDEALVALYNAYRLNGDQEGMASARRRLESEFPDSRFVAYLNDPDFFEKLDQIAIEREQVYAQTYSNFLFGQYQDVIQQSDVIIRSEGDNPLLPKYYLLRGLSWGKTGHTDAFKNDLDTLISHDPSSEEALLAKALLKHLEEGKSPVTGTLYASTVNSGDKVSSSEGPEAAAGPSPTFVYIEKEPYEVLVTGIDPSDMNRAIYNVADYNFSRYLVHDFDITQQTLINGENAIIISGFNTKSEAMDYFYSLREKPEFFNFDFFKNNILVISKSNQNPFYLSGLITEYRRFFDTYYLAPVEKAELDKVRVVEKTDAGQSAADKAEQATNRPKGDEPGIVSRLNAENENLPDTIPAGAEATGEIDAEPVPEPEPLVPFVYEATEAHLVIVMIEKVRLDFDRLQTIYTNYTRNNHGDKLKVSLVDDIDGYRTIKVEGFKSAAEARSYADEIRSNPILKRDILNREHYIWEISGSNYQILTETEQISEYDEFHKSTY